MVKVKSIQKLSIKKNKFTNLIIAGLDASPQIVYVTFARHLAFGSVLGLYLSRKGGVE